ncbi:MAG TPA: mannose-1-phosphate guanylyltransferase [Dermatophilaceae bacterium]|nr:mannose-1-phosphate guanylyltransferase [Dermatophilaceae bacterium]
MSAIEGFWAVIPAGGAGTRLWPLSRAAAPKFLLDLTGSGRTLLQQTWDRLQPLCADRVVVVTGIRHQEAVRAQLPALAGSQVLAEPSPRDSMAAIGLAAAVLERKDPGAVIGSFAADHVVSRVEAFHEAVRQAVAVARAGYLVTIGIAPTHPATGFGYIHLGDPLSVPDATAARQVRAFQEKPDQATATAYLRSGEFRWNAGMFVARASVVLDLLADYHPGLAAGLRDIAAEPGRLAELWPGLLKIPIDTAVAEPAAADGRVAVVPADLGWEDVGDFAALATLLAEAADQPGLRVLGDPAQVLALDASGVVVPSSGRVVAVLGLDDVVVVDTSDAVLVTTRDRAQDVKSLVDALKAAGRLDLT